MENSIIVTPLTNAEKVSLIASLVQLSQTQKLDDMCRPTIALALDNEEIDNVLCIVGALTKNLLRYERISFNLKQSHLNIFDQKFPEFKLTKEQIDSLLK